jgi:hypothetical protein
MSAKILTYVTELYVCIETPPEVNEVVAVLDGAGRVCNKDAHAGIRLRQDEPLDDLQEVRIVVNAGLQIVCEYRDAARRLIGNVNDRLAHFFLRRNDPPPILFSRFFHHLPSFIVT